MAALEPVVDLIMSLPSRERGLKCDSYGDLLLTNVAPFAGAWIEMWAQYGQQTIERSLPSRERGLKLVM